MSKHEGIIVATDETDHIAFLCPKCENPMAVDKVFTPLTTLGEISSENVTHIYLTCTGCGHDHWRKFDWAGKTAEICKHRTDAANGYSDLLAAFDDALNQNPFLMFEIGYTRVTDWMVHIWDKRGGGEARKIITTQHPYRDEACREAAELLRCHIKGGQS